MNNGAQSGGSFAKRKTVVVWTDNKNRRSQLGAMASLCGCTVLEDDAMQAADYLLADHCTKTEQSADFLSKIVRYVESHFSTALIWTDLGRLDEAYAALSQSQCHFLVDANDADAMPILAGVYGRSAMSQLHDRDRQVEFGSLHRMSDELAEFARTLARIAEADTKPSLSGKPVSFRPAPAGSFNRFPLKKVDAPARAVDASTIREMIKLRRLRNSFLGNDLFADPAWDILLDLMAAQMEKQNVSVSSLCIAAAVPPTTALRWIAAMTQSGMLVRRDDPDDARRVFIMLSEDMAAKLEDYFANAEWQSVPVI